MKSSRENILTRLNCCVIEDKPILPKITNPKDIYNLYPTSTDEMYTCFKERFLFLKGELIEVNSTEEGANKLLELIASYKQGVTDNSLLCNSIQAELSNSGITKFTNFSEVTSSHDYSKYEFGMSSCDALCARTGSILLSSNISGGRRLSVLPPHHIVLAYSSQLLPSFLPWLSRIRDNFASNYSVIISGPSRTSDIEKILVLGAHGPKRLSLIIISQHN